MKFKDLPDLYKMFVFKISDGREFLVNGVVKKNILASKSNFIELDNENGFNKAYIVSWRLNTDETRDNIRKHKEEIKSLEAKNI